jgi:hypothetical protein
VEQLFAVSRFEAIHGMNLCFFLLLGKLLQFAVVKKYAEAIAALIDFDTVAVLLSHGQQAFRAVDLFEFQVHAGSLAEAGGGVVYNLCWWL